MQGVFLPELCMEVWLGLMILLTRLLKPGDLLMLLVYICCRYFNCLSFEPLRSMFWSLEANGFSPDAPSLPY
jgi:hypothetical protein